MQNSATEELYKLCQQWFHDSQLRTIASQVEPIRQRSGSGILKLGAIQMGSLKTGAIEVRSSSAVAKYDVDGQNIAIHKLDFPGIPQADPIVKISFDEMVCIQAYIEAKAKK